MEAAILIGIQGSGKSTFVRRRLFDTHVRINLDMLRTRAREAILVEACLRARQSFVVDNTNPTRADRQRYLPPARQAGFRTVAYWFDMAFEECLARNAGRTGRQCIPPAALRHCLSRLQPPTFDEGLDAICRVWIDPAGEFVLEEITPQRPSRPPGPPG